MKSLRLFPLALVSSLLLLPALAQAHPGHSALDMSAGAPHAGHAPEWASLLIFIGITGMLMGIRWIASRR